MGAIGMNEEATVTATALRLGLFGAVSIAVIALFVGYPSFADIGVAQPPYKLTIALDPPIAQLALPPIHGSADPKRPMVVIDAGHGGHDPGAVHGDVREEEVALAVSRAIRDRLVESGRVRVALTRNGDSFLTLRERFEIARRLGADLFVSVHADAARRDGAHGATIYTLSEVASDEEAATLAARENKADIIGGVDLGGRPSEVASILIDLAQRETMDDAAAFARLLRRESTDVPFRDDYHRTASLLVLKAPDVPSILFEAGYVTNEKDVAFIASPEGQQAIANGFARAVEVHFARRMALR